MLCGALAVRTRGPHDKTTTKIAAEVITSPTAEPIIKRWVATQWTLREGIRTEVVSASAAENEDLAGYDPAQDRGLYEYYLAEERYYEMT